MRFGRRLLPALLTVLLGAVQASAQQSPATVTGRIVDAATQRALAGVAVSIEGRSAVTSADGSFTLNGVPSGARTLRASRVGYGEATKPVTLEPGRVNALGDVALSAQAVQLEEIVAVGYGTQKRQAITGSVSTVDVAAANKGVITNANQLIQGRVPGVNVVQNSGEPGAGAQIRIRGGTSITASNEPLYVIDGVPLDNISTEPGGVGIGGGAPLRRSPLTLLNPNDIQSITILKDAASTAIYGSRAANGVVLIETKTGRSGGGVEYEGYVGMASPSRYLNVLNGDQYRTFIQQQVQQGNLSPDRLTGLGNENTNFERAVTRSAFTQNHNLSFTGGSGTTRYRASLNYLDQNGVVIDNGFQRIQGRLNGTTTGLSDRLHLDANLTASRVDNKYLPYENTGGFEGGVFTNTVIFNPTQPVTFVDPATGLTRYYEVGLGAQSVRNPVALARQIDDIGNTTRTLGNATARLDLLPGISAEVLAGADHSAGIRRIYFPIASPVGAADNGHAWNRNQDVTSLVFHSLLTAHRDFSESGLDLVGGYEWNQTSESGFGAETRNFITDAFRYYNLSGGSTVEIPYSFRNDSRLASFFTRGTFSLKNRYYLTGVLRRDGSSRFGAANKWALFPAISGSWRLSEEPFMKGMGLFSDLRLRAGYGLQGNPAVPPYESLTLLGTSGGFRYVLGEQAVTGVAPTRNANPNLKWEQTAQFNVGLDYGLFDNVLTGSIEYYTKRTTDLLLRVVVPQPAVASDRLENVGEVRNRGVELALDALALDRPNLTWRAGLTFAADRNEVVSLGPYTFLTTGRVSGQGQSGQLAQRIIPGYALGTFYGPVFAGVNAQGKQEFACAQASTGCVNGRTTSPLANDYQVLGRADPNFIAGLTSQVNWGNVDFSFLFRTEVGGKVFNNTALVYSTKGNALQNKNFLVSALNDPTGIREPAIYSSRWLESRTFGRLQNVTLGYTFGVPGQAIRDARVYVSGDNLLLITNYSGYDPEVFVDASQNGLPSRGIDYLTYPRPRTITAGVRVAF